MAVRNLSDLARGTIVADSSMHAGNTVSVNPPFSPVGSESEATQGIEFHSRPEPDLGANNDGQLKTTMNDAGERPRSDYTWKRCNP